jgi:hypothetical protein
MGILAYIDPGSGSLLLQALLAALLSVPFFFRRTIGGVWHKLRGVKAVDTARDTTERPDR